MTAMIPDGNLVRYACVAHLPTATTSDADLSTTTVLAEFNTGDASLQELALECLMRTPTNHSIFNHSIRGCAYTFFIEDPFVFFSISDERFSKSDRIWLLSRMRDALQDLIRKRSINWRKKTDLRNRQQRRYTSYCFQGDLIPVFDQLLIPKGGGGGEGEDPIINVVKVNSGVGNQSDYQVERKSGVDNDGARKTWGIPFFLKKKKKKRDSGESMGYSGDMLVKGGAELSSSSDHGVEISSREIITMGSSSQQQKGDVGDGELSKEKVRKWRFYVWVVLVLDLVVCLILFGIWLMICHGFHCLKTLNG